MTELATMVATLGLKPTDTVVIFQTTVGGRHRQTFVSVADLGGIDTEGWNTWACFNPFKPGATKRTAEHLSRVVALVADLDRKPDGLRDDETITMVVERISDVLGQGPSLMVDSGHGVQPYWPMEGDDVAMAAELLVRFGLLVRVIAAELGGSVDSTWTPERVWRAPGTINLKGDPVPARLVYVEDLPALTMDDLAKRLDDAGVRELEPDAVRISREPLSSPEEWRYGESTGRYVSAMIAGWTKDTPDSRHGWLISGLTRLHCAHRLGCITAEDHRMAAEVLEDRLETLVVTTEPVRAVGLYEVAGANLWALARACAKDDDETREELGDHEHGGLTITEAAGVDDVIKFAAELSDSEVARSLSDDLGREIAFTKGRGWLAWDGRRWAPTVEPAIGARVDAALRAKVAAEIVRGASPDRRKGLDTLLSTRRLENIVRRLKGLLHHDDAEFDAHPFLLCVGNGTVALRTGDLRPHDPADYLTRCTTVDYHLGAEHDDWQAALQAVIEPEWLQLRMGQAATGKPPEDDVMVVMLGGGENGKSTIMVALSEALGDYAVPVPDKVLLAGENQHPTELMTLLGARWGFIEELPEAGRLNVIRLKNAVGKPELTARAVFKDNVVWTPTHTLMITTNYLPRVPEADHATWRRLALLNFPYRFTGSPELENDRPRDSGLRERMRGRRQVEAVLAWVVAGAVRALNDGLGSLPDSVRDATNEWRRGSDQVAEFIEEHLVIEPGWVVKGSELLREFNQWQDDTGHARWSDSTLKRRFEDHELLRAVKYGSHRIGERRRLSSLDDLGAADRVRGWDGVRWHE